MEPKILASCPPLVVAYGTNAMSSVLLDATCKVLGWCRDQGVQSTVHTHTTALQWATSPNATLMHVHQHRRAAIVACSVL
jgi:hypothetical protein